jgi:predicted DCC family thiol-disulfide oxidoreductase YuxK
MTAVRGTARGTLLFDGDCSFCTAAARRAIRINPGASVVAWQQADLAALGVTAAEATAALQYVGGARAGAGSDAIALFLVDAGGLYRVAGRFLLVPGIRPLAQVAYRWVAAHRYRLPGGSPACAVTPPDPTPR